MEWNVSNMVWKWHWKEWNEIILQKITIIPLILKNIKNDSSLWEKKNLL